jgi:hypothetical protein
MILLRPPASGFSNKEHTLVRKPRNRVALVHAGQLVTQTKHKKVRGVAQLGNLLGGTLCTRTRKEACTLAHVHKKRMHMHARTHLVCTLKARNLCLPCKLTLQNTRNSGIMDCNIICAIYCIPVRMQILRLPIAPKEVNWNRCGSLLHSRCKMIINEYCFTERLVAWHTCICTIIN